MDFPAEGHTARDSELVSCLHRAACRLQDLPREAVVMILAHIDWALPISQAPSSSSLVHSKQ